MTRWPLGRRIYHSEYVKVNTANSNFIGSISAEGIKAVQQEATKTVVLMLHHGQPRTQYYATKHLAEGSHYYYKIPLWLTSFVTQLYWPYAKKVNFCVNNNKYGENFSNHIITYSKVLQGYLDELVPEYAPFCCTHAFLYNEPAIPRTISELIRHGMERLILLPLYPHYSSFQTGTMLNIAVKAIDEQTKPMSEDGIYSMDYRVRTMSHVSFRCSTIDRWSNHPGVLNFWYDMMCMELKDHDSLLFVAPQMRGYNSSGYIREIWVTCYRLMEHLNEAVPWKLAWFSGWDQWPATTLDNIKLQLYFLRREKRYRTLVVPIASIIPSFESEALLPNILKNENADLLPPPGFSPVLAHGFAELIKNHLMGRRASSLLPHRYKFYSS